ncbi:MAG: Shikimate dehydrogenase [Syntrophorhabdus sp. PtaU1.Bin153]|nr:MAG: Shikimate dehydrogenase [Syntrophorhabdus sp. PtaU1.Bin153]
MRSDTKILAVAGNPVLHSKSPLMFRAAFKAMSVDAVYTRFAASDGRDISDTVKAMGISGINITSPFKEEIVPFLDHVEDRARRLGAVNTVAVTNGRTEGYNTDVDGAKNAFLANGIDLAGRKAVILGGGGAAKAAVLGFIEEGARVVIANRSFEKAEQIAKELGCRAGRFGDIGEELKSADILLSCLPALEDRVVDGRDLTERLVVLDAYYQGETCLVKDAREKGCKVIDGREWLLFQGTEAFARFTGLEPPIGVMRKALYDKGSEDEGKKNIALIGFMGTGKTSVARDLGKTLKRPVVDIDALIEEKAGRSIAEIFRTEGEHAFRDIEKREVHRVAGISGTVIACGGGAVIDGENVAVLKENCLVVWLWAGRDTIRERVGDNGERPLLAEARRKHAMDVIFAERIPFYARAADLVVATDGRTIQETVKRIAYESDTFLSH